MHPFNGISRIKHILRQPMSLSRNHGSGRTVVAKFCTVSTGLVQFKIVFTCSGKPMCTPPPSLRVVRGVSFGKVPILVRLAMAPSRHPFPGSSPNASFFCTSPPGDRWCDVLGFVSAGYCLELLNNSETKAICEGCFSSQLLHANIPS